jgi:hypothetical protein
LLATLSAVALILVQHHFEAPTSATSDSTYFTLFGYENEEETYGDQDLLNEDLEHLPDGLVRLMLHLLPHYLERFSAGLTPILSPEQCE